MAESEQTAKPGKELLIKHTENSLRVVYLNSQVENLIKHGWLCTGVQKLYCLSSGEKN